MKDTLPEGCYIVLESFLRETIKLCLLDEKFGDSFREDDTVNALLPFRAKPKAVA